MACGCTDKLNMNNKRLDNNTQLTNNKTLYLEDMKNMSIDEIINLYKLGYMLEERSIENDNYINNLTYDTECSGTPVIDKSDSHELNYVGCYINSAFAQKFVPASQCLSKVTIKVLRQATYGSGVTIHIVPDVGGLPPNNWLGGSIASATVPSSQIPTTATEVNFPLNLKLNNLNPLWIVVTSDYYDSTATDYSSEYIRISNSTTGSGGMAEFYSGAWTSYPTWNIVYKTWKTTYGSSQVLTSISPANSSVQKNSTQPFTAKDQSNNPITTGVIWARTAGVGMIDPLTGLYSAGATAGTATISATYAGVTKTTSITVASEAQVLTLISPSSPTILINTTEQFIARDQSNHPITTGVAWAKTTGVGSIGASTGLYSAGATAGTATISATYAGVTKINYVTVSTTPPATEGGGSSILIGIVGVVALGMMMTAKKPQ